jgi:RimJ/RimL family protein N-acetyltransferase/GNAT superfamily N-acetyltransferase
VTFSPIETERLLIRAVQADDAAALHARRNDPEVAWLGDWTTPFPDGSARSLVDGVAKMDGPQPDEWWMATIVEPETGQIIGDLAVLLNRGGRSAEIGYTLDSSVWGNGYATEAVDALVDRLFESSALTRISASLNPENVASAMVLERTGFVYEGHTRLSHWVGDANTDDWIYGLTREDRQTWKSRPRTPPQDLRLDPITEDTMYDVLRLRTHKTQESFVAPMAYSYADALFPEVVDGAPVVPWMRAVVADEEIVGFVMLAITTEHHPEPYLWRLLIDRLHQRRGIGGGVIDLIARECRARGDRTLLTSWEEGRGSPAPFYIKHGFETTGRIVDEETEARLVLA